MSIEAALYSKLTGDATLSGLMSSRWYPLWLPQDPTLPAGVYRRVTTSQDMAHDGAIDIEWLRMQLDIYAESFADVREVANAVRDCINGFSGTVDSTKVWSVIFDNEVDDWTDLTEVYRITQDYHINWQYGT